MAPTCFGNYMPSSGSIWVPSELLVCWSDWVVGHLVCSRKIYVTACRVLICCASLPSAHLVVWHNRSIHDWQISGHWLPYSWIVLLLQTQGYHAKIWVYRLDILTEVLSCFSVPPGKLQDKISN
jgi:hypothetical protein